MTPIDYEILDWIGAHADDDVCALRLRHAGDAELSEAITQIECRRKCVTKLPEFLSHRGIWFPSTIAAEQCTSEALARFHASLVPEGATVVDLACGLGIDAMAIARRACSVVAIDLDPAKAECLNHNAKTLGISNIDARCADAVEYVETTDERFDVAFIDPARRDNRGGRVYALKDCTPDVLAMLPAILRVAKRLIIKMSPMLDVTHTLSELGCSATIHAIGTPKECKELVAICPAGPPQTPSQGEGLLKLVATTILPDNSIINYTPSLPSNPEAPPFRGGMGGADERHLLEPWPSVMKIAPWDSLCHDFGVQQISADTHLFVSDMPPAGFPGDVWHIKRVCGFSKRDLAELRRDYRAINVAARGIGMSADALRAKLWVKDSPTQSPKIFGVKMADGSRKLIIAEAVK